MLKNFKGLFVKTDEEESVKKPVQPDMISFPVNPTTPIVPSQHSTPSPQVTQEASFNEVLKVYEEGLDSINMPGYDFYEFYQALISTGNGTEQAYNMAYQMARTLDKTITPQKLINDAEFYISKINEVYNQYVAQGQQKLNSLQEKKGSQKTKLNSDIDKATQRISQLRTELHQLEAEIANKKNELGKIDESFSPQENTIKEKLNANDLARKTSIDRLMIVKEGILKYIKG